MIYKTIGQKHKGNTDMLLAMFDLQLGMDRKTIEEYKITYSDFFKKDACFNILLEKFGELAHEMKCYGYPWEEYIEEPGRSKILEKFAEITHLILHYCLAVNYLDNDPALNRYLIYKEKPYNWKWDEDKATNIWSWRETVIHLLRGVCSTSWTAPKERSLETISITEILTFWNNLIELAVFDFEEDVYNPFVKYMIKRYNQPSS